MTITVAALYVERSGPYFDLPGVDPWDKERDARLYDGPHPVVAHPPCGPWSKLRHLYRGDEHDCAERAVEQVRAWGGVLEHPAGSQLWREAKLPRPGELPDAHGGRSLEVCQVDWGHPARKRTWLYVVGAPELPPMPPPREPTHWCSAHRYGGSARRRVDAPPPGIKVCSAQQRRRTPLAFAEWLVAIARSARGTLEATG